MTHTTDHLVVLMKRLSIETARHGDNPAMAVYLAGIRKEIASEEAFLAARGVSIYNADDVTDADLEDLLADF